MLVSDEIRALLSKPFSGFCPIETIVSTEGKKLVSIGDRVTLDTLRLGKHPYVAVFDYKTERKPIDGESRALLEKSFPTRSTIENPPGHFNEELLPLAKRVMQNGGAVFVEGEEDITGLAFMFYATEDHIVYYGMRGQGVVALEGVQAASIAKYLLNRMGLSLFDV